MDCSSFSNSSVSVRLRWEEVLALDILKRRTLQPDRNALKVGLYTDHGKYKNATDLGLRERDSATGTLAGLARGQWRKSEADDECCARLLPSGSPACGTLLLHTYEYPSQLLICLIIER